MRLDSTSTIETTFGERKLCTFDQSGAAHIMSMLSNIYGNSKAAVLREYAANGLDSHVAAGVKLPVEVELPSSLNPVLTISDYGLGLDLAGIENVYAKYGSSTKRSENDSIGGFGIGAKSAFTVASQFTISSVKDGQHVIAVFSMDEDGPGYNILSVTETERGNGVTVQIPCPDSDIEVWHNEATAVFRTWPTGSVTVNGENPESIFDTAKSIVPGLWWATERLDSIFKVVVGGVSYSGSWSIINAMPYELRKVLSSHRAIIEVPIGSVHIAPNRESLRDTSTTIEAIRAGIDGAIEAINTKVAADIEGASTDLDKVKVWVEAKNIYSDLTTPTKPDNIAEKVFLRSVISGGNGTRTMRNHTVEMGWSGVIEALRNTVVISGEMTGAASRLLARWRKANGWPKVMLAGSATEFDWLPVSAFERVVPVETMVAEARDLPPVKGKGTAGARSIGYDIADGWNQLASRHNLEDILDGEDVLLGDIPTAVRLRDLGEDVRVLVLSGNQSYDLLVKRLGYTPKLAADVYAALKEARIKAVTKAHLQGYADMFWIARRESLVNLIDSRATGKLATLMATMRANAAMVDDDTRNIIAQFSLPIPSSTVEQVNPLLTFVADNLGWRNSLSAELSDSIIEQMD